MSLHYNGDNSYLYVTKTEIYKFEAHDNIHWYEFYLLSTPKDIMKDEQSEVSFNGTMYEFFVSHSS